MKITPFAPHALQMVDVYTPTTISEKELAKIVADPIQWQSRFGVRGRQLHRGQIEWLTTHAKVKVACWGRQSGKSMMLGENDIPRWSLSRPDTVQWLLAPTQDQSNIIFEYMASVMMGTILEKPFVKDYSENPWPSMTFFNDAIVGARNMAERAKNTRGRRADKINVDEAAFVDEEAVDAVIPMLFASPYQEEAYISTPNGLNYFWNLWKLGKNNPDGEIRSYHMASWRSPFSQKSFLKRERLKRTDTAWRTEYGAEFVEDQNAPFPETIIDAAIDDSLACPADPQPGHRYVLGYDPADAMDRSGLITVDTTFLPWRVVNVQDIAGRGWNAQIYAVKKESQRYSNARLLMDATHGSVGDPLLTNLHDEGLRVEGLKFTAESKRQLIDGLSLLMEQGDIRFPRHLDLIQELTLYRRDVSKTSASHRVRYGAAAGQHDDLVTALALACQHAKRHRYTGNQTAVGGKRAILEHYDQARLN